MVKQERAATYRDNYKKWKLSLLENRTGFFPLFVPIMDENVLSRISGNAIRLYVYPGSVGLVSTRWPGISKRAKERFQSNLVTPLMVTGYTSLHVSASLVDLPRESIVSGCCDSV